MLCGGYWILPATNYIHLASDGTNSQAVRRTVTVICLAIYVRRYEYQAIVTSSHTHMLLMGTLFNRRPYGKFTWPVQPNHEQPKMKSPIQPNVALFMPDKQTGLSEGGRYYYIIHFFSILVFFLDHRKITNQKITQNVTIIVGMILNSFLIDSPRQSFRKYTKG